MRNARPVVMIVVSLMAGIAAVVLAMRWLAEQGTMPTSRVAVAMVDFEAGQPIGQQQIRMIEWPVGSVPAGTFNAADLLEGRVVKTKVLRDEPILESRLAPKGTKGGLSAVIADGKRAITVRVNDVVGVAGFALPGNYVDVIVNTRDERAQPGPSRDIFISKIVLEKMLVLAVAQEASRDDTKPKVVNAVTIEVSPEEAEKLDLARSVGTLSLVLRNQVDTKSARTAGVTKETLLDLPIIAAAAVPRSAPAPQPIRQRASAATPSAPAAPQQTCVDAWTGADRKQECF